MGALLNINNSESFMPQRIYLLQSVVNALSSPRCASSAFTLISGLLHKTEMPGWKQLTSELLREMNICQIVRNVSHDNKKVCKTSAQLIKQLIESSSQSDLFQVLGESSRLFEVINEQLEQIYNILNGKCTELMRTTFMEDIERLGEEKLVVADMLASLIKLKNQQINSDLAMLKVSETLVHLFFKFEWNSMFHNVFYSYITAVLTCENEDLRSDLLFSSNFIPKLVETGVKRSRPGTMNPDLTSGLRGHVKKIAQFLVEQSENQSDLSKLLDNFPAWQKFDEEFLRPQTEIEARALGGGTSLNLGPASDDEDNFFTFKETDQEKNFHGNEVDDIEEELEGIDEEPLTLEDLGDFEKMLKKPANNRYEDQEEEESHPSSFYAATFWKVVDSSISLETLD